jgi:Endodeoxyribonuclease RusA
MAPEIVTHWIASSPVYQLFVYQRPTQSGKGREAYFEAVRREAQLRIETPLDTSDVEISLIYSTRRLISIRSDVDNILKPTLDALKGHAYRDDNQVRAVAARLFDRSRPFALGFESNLGLALVNSLCHATCEDVVIVHVYSDARLRELGHEEVIARLQAEALAETDRIYRETSVNKSSERA